MGILNDDGMQADLRISLIFLRLGNSALPKRMMNIPAAETKADPYS